MKQYNTIGFGQINILNNPKHSIQRYEALAETLKNNPMDFLAVQEVVFPEELLSILSEIGYEYAVYGSMLPNNHGMGNCVGILSKTPLTKIEFKNEWDGSLIAAQTTVKGQLYNIFSAHLAWGPANGFTRLQQVSLIEEVAASQENLNKGSISIMGGDLNADPEARPIRFLKGYDLGSDNTSTTLWLDAHDLAGNSDNWTTSDHAVNPYGIETAMSTGVIDTDFIPQRRIDYIFARGWLYGKNGCPVDFGYLTHPDGVILSDHNGIYSRIAKIF